VAVENSAMLVHFTHFDVPRRSSLQARTEASMVSPVDTKPSASLTGSVVIMSIKLVILP
jgi:hypothetical protein